MKKKISILLLSLVFAFNTCTFIGYAEDDIHVTLNGAELSFDVPPQLIDNRTMVPLRKIFEAMGAAVDWNNDTRTVTATKGNERVIATIDSKNVYVSGDTKTLDVPPLIVDGRTLVPVRFVAESFGANVNWDEATRTVIISTKWDGNGEVPCYSKYPEIPDLGAVLGIWGTESNADSTGAIYSYNIKDVSSLFPYISALESCGFDVNAGYSDMILYTGVKDETYVDIVLWDDKIDVTITLPENQISISDFTNGYALADFEKYNSYASENGLSDSPIYIDCTISKVEVIGNDKAKALIGYATDIDGNEWLITLHSTMFDNEETYKHIIGKSLVLCGLYGGYSNDKKMPVIYLYQLLVKDSGEIKYGIATLK